MWETKRSMKCNKKLYSCPWRKMASLCDSIFLMKFYIYKTCIGNVEKWVWGWFPCIFQISSWMIKTWKIRNDSLIYRSYINCKVFVRSCSFEILCLNIEISIASSRRCILSNASSMKKQELFSHDELRMRLVKNCDSEMSNSFISTTTNHFSIHQTI